MPPKSSDCDGSEGSEDAAEASSDSAVGRAALAAGSGGATAQQSPQCLLEAKFVCHRGKKEKDSRQADEKREPRSKKVNCPFEILLRVDKERPGTVVITERHGHFGHTPGVGEDNEWLKLGASVDAQIRQVCMSVVTDSTGCRQRQPGCFG